MTAATIRVEGSIAFVPLSRGMEAVIDAADIPLIKGVSWYAHKAPNSFYAYSTAWKGRTRLIMHRVILAVPSGLMVDHIDGDGLNNRRSNLRSATKSENGRNQRIARHNTSGFKGVHYRADVGKWRAEIQLLGRKHNVGFFATPEEAHAAYCKASAELHGEYGRVS